MAFHAKLSPSSAHRWMNCAGSVKLIGDEPNAAGLPAMMGTAAHKVIETMLQKGERDAHAYHNWQILVHKPGEHETKMFPPGAPINIEEDWFLFICDDKMVDGVQMMIDEVQRTLDDCFDPELHTERFLDMSWLDDRLGGTADVSIIDVDWIYLKDYKNGRVLVEVKGNEQMKNYAVGLLHEHPHARGVTVTLVQPNAVHEDGCIREESYSADELKLFEIQMKAAAMATSKPNAPRRAGEWCTYCPANIRCKEFEAMALEQAGADFASDPIDAPLPEQVMPAYVAGGDGGDEEAAAAWRVELARKRKWIPVLDQWARNISQAIFNEKMSGHDVPGVKLVQGKTNRAYVGDVASTAAALIEGGLPEDQLYTEPKLKTPAQVEKIRPPGMKAAAVKAIVAPLVHKPPGRITIADADDPREEVDPAMAASADFAGDDPEEGDIG